VFNAFVGRARLAMPVHTGRGAPASVVRHHPSRPSPPCGQIVAPRWLLRGVRAATSARVSEKVRAQGSVPSVWRRSPMARSPCRGVVIRSNDWLTLPEVLFYQLHLRQCRHSKIRSIGAGSYTWPDEDPPCRTDQLPTGLSNASTSRNGLTTLSLMRILCTKSIAHHGTASHPPMYEGAKRNKQPRSILYNPKRPGQGKRHRKTTRTRHAGTTDARPPAARRVSCRAPRRRCRRAAVPAAATVAVMAAATAAAPPPMQRHSWCGGGGGGGGGGG